MLILSIDCAGNGCGVCIWRDGSVLCNLTEQMERGQDQRLMPMIMEALQKSGFTFDQLDRIAVTRGPGSFTGLRIGIAAARGIGLSANKPVLGIDRFSIYHEAFKPLPKDHFVIIDSRRKELYCHFYRASGATEEANMMTAEEIAEFLKRHPDIFITGDIDPHTFSPFHPLTSAEHILAAQLAASADPADPKFAPRPLYIRAPDVTMPKSQAGHPTNTRVLTLGDTAHLAALHAECFDLSPWDEAKIRGSLSLETTRGWGVFEGDKVIGFTLCQLIPGQSEILTLCTHPTQRRQGIAEKLIAIAAEAAHKAGSSLFLEVAADNDPALMLYEKIGFERTGTRPRYYQSGDTAIDAVLLTLHAEAQKFAS